MGLAASALAGWAMSRWFTRSPILRRAEAMAIVAGAWLVVGTFSAIPYMFAGISVVMLPFAVVWAIVALWLGRDYRRRARHLRDMGVQ